jgi:ATP-dependent Clp protease adaptor protein ClpS
MTGNRNKMFTKKKPGKQEDKDNDKMHSLVLHNDDIHTFEYVIQCLMEICGHDAMQAEQCTYLVHFKGSCDIIKGEYGQLLPFRNDMAAKELKVTID